MSLRSRLRSAPVAAVLSFLVPGLGQAGVGAYRRAALIALPALAVPLIALKIGVKGFEQGLVQPDFLTAVLVADLLLFAYHVWAIIDAYRLAERSAPRELAGGSAPRRSTWSPRETRPIGPRRPSTPGMATLGLVLVLAVGVHGIVAMPTIQLQDTLNGVFGQRPIWMTGGTPAAGETEDPMDTPDPNSSYTPPPDATDSLPPSAPPTVNPDWMADGTLNLLVIGSDAGKGRWSLRTDTMILLQVDLNSGKAAMYGIPRNLYNVPLAPDNARAFGCHCFPYPNMLNALYRYAEDNPKYFDGPDGVRGFKALEGAVGTFLGVNVDGSAVINLVGFVHLIDALAPKGIGIDVQTEIIDNAFPNWNGPGYTKIDIKPGYQVMDGVRALQYARSRHSADDYDRMRRQQQVLLALRKTVAHPCSLIPQVPSILQAIQGTFWTDLPMDSAPELLKVAERIGSGNIASYTFSPPDIPEYLTKSAIAKVRNIVAHGLDNVPAAAPSGGPGGGGGFNC